MNAVAGLAAATIFCVLQAIYWFVASKRSARQAFLAERLGTDDSLARTNELLRRDEDEGALARRLAGLIEEAGLDITIGGFFSRVVMWTAFVFLVLLIVLGSLGGALFLSLLITPVLQFRALAVRKRKRGRRIQEQLPEALEVMIISLRAGQSLEQTVRLTATQLDEPIGEEFRRVAEETELGRPLEQALLSMGERLSSVRSLRTFVTSVLVLRQTGGNLIEVLEAIIDTMRQRTQYERKLQAMTAEGRSSSRMLGGLPIVFVSLAYLADPTYVGRLFTDPLGNVLLGVAGSLYLIGMVWIRKLVNPES